MGVELAYRFDGVGDPPTLYTFLDEGEGGDPRKKQRHAIEIGERQTVWRTRPNRRQVDILHVRAFCGATAEFNNVDHQFDRRLPRCRSCIEGIRLWKPPAPPRTAYM